MALERRLIDLDVDNISIPDDDNDDRRNFSQESLPEAFTSNSRAEQSAKALEIAEERSLLPSAPLSPLPWNEGFAARPSGPSTSPDNTAAPPDYLAAIAADAAPPAISSSWTARMTEPMSDTGLLSQDRVERGDAYAPERFLASELMLVARQVWRIMVEYAQSVQKKRGRRFGLTKRVIRLIVAAVVVIILLAIFLPIIIRAIIRHNRDARWERERHPFRDHPAYKRDPHTDHPSTEMCKFEDFSEITESETNYRFDGRTLTWSSGSFSGGFTKRSTEERHRAKRYQFMEDRSFSLVEELDAGLPSDFTHPIISGTVEVISIPPPNPWYGQPITVRAYAATNKPWQFSTVPFVYSDEGGFALHTPGLFKASSSQSTSTSDHSCLNIWVGIYIPHGLEVSNWTTSLRSLNFVDHRNYVFNPVNPTPDAQQVPDGAVRVMNRTTIKLNQGSIDLSYWNSHETTVETRRGDIEGKFSFYDSLNVKTLGGEVEISVDPRGASLASRDHSRPLRFTTSSGSGDTTVNVLRPSTEDWTPHFMESVHRTSSGAMQLHYPSEWAGTIDAITTSDDAEVKGEGVHRVTETPDAPGEIHMLKGNRAVDWAGTLGKIDLESETGSISLVIGDI